MNFLILSSSRGTTMQAVINALQNRSLTAKCLGLISDREDRGCVEKARGAGLPVTIVDRKKNDDREEYDNQLHEAIVSMGGSPGDTVIATLGWMYILSPAFTKQWRKKIVNVHPALLPKHPGTHALRETLDAGDKETGMTIHFIDEGVDTGEIILQKSCPVKPGDTEETLKARIQELEKEWYPKVLEMIERGTISIC